MRRRLPLLLLGLALAGCSAEPASMLVAGSEVALTVERVQPNFWTDGWELKLIVRRNPECQRRHTLKPTGANNLRIEVYGPEPGVYILKQGKRWYVTELKDCGFQAFKEPPPEPGELLGTFREKGGTFRFVAVEGGEKAAAGEEG